MNDDVPKLPMHQPQIVIERSVVNASPIPKWEGNPFNEPAHHAENFNGLIVAASGTANASVVAPYTPTQEHVYIIPEFAPIPEVELQKQHLRKNYELVVYLGLNKQLTYALPAQTLTPGDAPHK
jgi:hypothetical protein